MAPPGDAALSPLLHASAMLLFPATMGLSTSLCLARSPSPYTLVSLHETVELTRTLDRLWLAGVVGWTLLALLGGGSSSTSPGGTGLAFLVASVTLAMIGAHVWFRSRLTPELADAAASVRSGGPVTTAGDDGRLVAQRREPEEIRALASAPRGVRIHLAGALGCLALFALVGQALGAGASWARAVQCLLLAGFWVSLGVLFIDLVEDVWPGFTSDERLARASRYYVQIFEQWKNMGVLIALLTVTGGAPVAWALGYAPLAVISFPVWIVACIVFATFFNRVLLPNGLVTSRLPLPVWVNEYSTRRPLWAHFFTVIHLVMAAGLMAGLVGLHRTLG